MIELGEFERVHEEFAKRNVRVVVVSNDSQPISRKTQADMPHLVVVSDADQNLAKAIEVIHAGAAKDGGDTNVPTTFLVDGDGSVRWLWRPDRFIVRLPANELLGHIDSELPKSQ